MLTVTKSYDELIDDTLQEVGRFDERGYRVQLDGAGLFGTTTTTCSLVDASRVSVSDVIEFENELVLVTGMTSDPIPVLTVARGYDNSVAENHGPDQVGIVNPQFSRVRVGKALQNAMGRLESARIYMVTSATFNRTPGKQYVEMPTNCRQVLRVAVMDQYGRIDELDEWRYFDNVPTDQVTSGQIVRLPRIIGDDDDLLITYRVAWRWSSHPAAPTGGDLITLPEGCEDLPVLYATARLVSHRELSRLDLDRSEEWNKSQGVIQGVTSGMVRQLWQEFYKALDEAKQFNVLPVVRPFVAKRRFL